MESVSLDPGVFYPVDGDARRHRVASPPRLKKSGVLEALGSIAILMRLSMGQTELDVAATAETTVLVLVPESGDGIQTLKAGVMEIASCI